MSKPVHRPFEIEHAEASPIEIFPVDDAVIAILPLGSKVYSAVRHDKSE